MSNLCFENKNIFEIATKIKKRNPKIVVIKGAFL
jgi:hypothetical protein